MFLLIVYFIHASFLACTRLKEAKFIVVAVPTPVKDDNSPDLRPVEGASKTVGQNLAPGSIVVFESTVYPGVTEDICIPIIEKESGLKCGVDWKIGYSPERINPADRIHTLTTIRKVVSGMDKESAEEIKKVYDIVIKAGTFPVSNIKTAEAVKVVENSQRDINIAFMNEIAIICDKDVKFICLGDGELKEQIEMTAKKSKIDNMFEFLGVSNNVSHYLYNSDIFILPSKWEGLPISVIEAMAVGIPIIASNVGGVGDLISSNKNGLLIKPNPNELADSINRLINDKFLRETIGKKAIFDSRRYSVEKMAESYLSLYSIKKNKMKYD